MSVLKSPTPGSSVRDAPHRRRGALALVGVLTISIAGCGGRARDESDGRRAAAEPTPVESRRAIVENEGKKNPPQRAPSSDTAITQGTGEVPPQLLAIFQDDLARRALVKPETITVVSATEQQWSDGSMGCPQPGQMYTQMIVPGYRVVLQAAGNKYSYHSDRRGNFVVCSSGLAFPPVKEQAKGQNPAE